MDFGISNILCTIGILLPLLYGLYLFFARLTLTFVNKKILNYGCTTINLLSFLLFIATNFYALDKTQIAKYDFNLFFLEKFSLDFGIFVNEANISYLILSSFLCFIISLFCGLYFKKKKQFIFTKQRYYIFLSLISFLNYLFIVSSNLFETLIILFLQSTLIAIFANIDIFKHPKNFNITRFHRISQIGNFSLLVAFMILFRYAILSKGYIASNSINFTEFNMLISYTYGISSSLEFKIMSACLIITIMSRLMIFPFSCYYSFFANSSNIMYLTVATLANNITGIYLYTKTIPLIQLSKCHIVFLKSFIILGIILSIVQILFEKNIKIIFGYLLSAINSVFVILFLYFEINTIQNIYFITNSIFILVLMFFFISDKENFKKRLINRQMGFILEKTHIVIFETIPQKVTTILNIIDQKIFKNISLLITSFLAYLLSLLVIKTIKTSRIENIRNILIIMAFFIILAIFITLFGGAK